MKVEKPWEKEPNYEDFTHAGYPCKIMRIPDLLHLCGYVGIPKDHPYYGKDDYDLEGLLDVHGGVSFAAAPIEDEKHKDLWWIGFDCAHAGDLWPGRSNLGFPGSTYKDINYVREETKKLAEQLKEKHETHKDVP